MEKIVNYIKYGKGLGLLFIFATSLLLTLVFTLMVKDFYKEVRPQIITVANDFLPLNIQKGVIVEPSDTYKRVDIDLGNNGDKKDVIAVVLNTHNDVSVSPQDDSGIYILKNKLYLISSQQMKFYNFQDGVWTIDRFEELMEDISGVILGVVSIALIIVQFIVYLAQAVLAVGVGVIALKIMQKEDLINITMLMRLCAVLIAGLQCLRWICIFVGINITSFMVFLALILLEIYFIRQFIKSSDEISN